MKNAIARLESAAAGFRLFWRDGGEPLAAPWLWLRDNAPQAMNPQTGQREIDTAALPAAAPAAAQVAEDGAALQVRWDDGGDIQIIPADYLAAVCGGESPPPQTLWDAPPSGENRMDYAAVAAGRGFAEWLECAARYGFALVRGVPDAAAGRALLEKIGYVRETIFGGFWQFQADGQHADSAYTNGELGPHTDGSYSLDPPGCQYLQCLAFDGEGGDSVIVDGFAIGEKIRADAPELFAALCEIDIPARYWDGERRISLRARHPVFTLDSSGAIAQVCFNNYDRAPFLPPPDKVGIFYDALQMFQRLAQDRKRQWRRRLGAGDAILFDNWRVLHGRAAYRGKRAMAGGYVNREDFQSRLRIINGGGARL